LRSYFEIAGGEAAARDRQDEVQLVLTKLDLGLSARQVTKYDHNLPDSNPYGRDGLAHSRSLSTVRRALRVA